MQCRVVLSSSTKFRFTLFVGFASFAFKIFDNYLIALFADCLSPYKRTPLIKTIADNRTRYKKWKVQLETEKSLLENKIVDLNVPASKLWSRLQSKLSLLADISKVFNTADVIQKQAFVRLVFYSGLTFDGTIYRTPHIIGLFAPKAALLKEKGLLEIEQSLEKLGDGRLSAPGGT